MKQEWENIAAALLLFLERQFVNVGLKSNLTGFLLCAPQSYKSHTSCTVTYGSCWRQCAAVTAVIDSRVAAPCRRFIMDSLSSDIRGDNFMQWSTGKWTLPHSRLLINTLDHFLIFIFLSSNYFSLSYCTCSTIIFPFTASFLQYTFIFIDERAADYSEFSEGRGPHMRIF